MNKKVQGLSCFLSKNLYPISGEAKYILIYKNLNIKNEGKNMQHLCSLMSVYEFLKDCYVRNLEAKMVPAKYSSNQ